MFKLFFAIILSVHAGWWQHKTGWLHKICDRHLVTDDPYQFEAYETPWLIRELDRLTIKARWGALSQKESNLHRIIREEVKNRLSRMSEEQLLLVERLNLVDQVADPVAP